jgi:pantetheine-phosphate adenylyltransferase
MPVVALGGTFDHLHAGHKILLSMAAWIARKKVIVGVTGSALSPPLLLVGLHTTLTLTNKTLDENLLVNKANKHVLESLIHRTDRVRSFLTSFKPSLEYDIVPIQDVYGPTAVDPDIQALVVSKETLSGGAASQSISPTALFTDSDLKSTHSR